MKALVTGGAGFIGSNFILDWLALHDEPVVNVDVLTYAANPKTLASLDGDRRYAFERADICDRAAIDAILAKYQPRAVVHFAAFKAVGESTAQPLAYYRNNIGGLVTTVAVLARRMG